MAHAASIESAHIDLFVRKLRIKLAAWLGSDGGRSYRFGEQLEHLPELFGLTARVLLDDRLPTDLQPPLLGVVMYVISPADLLPESLQGAAGYADDLVACALVLDHVRQHLPDLPASHWHGPGNLEEILTALLADAEEIVGEGLLFQLRHWVGVRKRF